MTNRSVADFRIVRNDQGVDLRTQQLITHLHRGGALAFIQAFQGDRRRSAWYPVGKPLTPPAAWQTGHDLYFGVHPSSADESAKWVFRDGKRDQHGTYHASTNDCIAAVNCVFADHDGKDLTNPTQDEINAAFDILKAADLACVASGAKAKPQPDRALMNQAIGAAKDAKYQTDPDHYKALAKAHVDQLQPRPSVIVQSGGGWHCYWLLKDPFVITDEAKRDFAKRTQADWVRFVGGDPGAKDLRRILRLPGYRNYKAKYAPNFPVVSYEHFDLTLQYNLLDLVAAIPPAPVETTQHATPTQRSARATPADGTTPAATGTTAGTTDKHGIIDWFNRAVPIRDILSAYGYTGGAGDRLSRPGQPESTGVHIFADNRSYHHSSNDPLWNEAGHKRSPFDAYCVFEHGGNVQSAVSALADIVFGDFGLWVRSTSFADLIDPALRGQHYRTDEADTRTASAIVETMRKARTFRITKSTRIGGREAGIGAKTFERALERLQFMFDVEVSKVGYVVTLRTDLLVANDAPMTMLAKVLSASCTTSKNEYTPRLEDHAFQRGTSQHSKRRVNEIAGVLQRDALTNVANGGHALRTMYCIFSAWQRKNDKLIMPAKNKKLRCAIEKATRNARQPFLTTSEVRDAYTLKSLGETMLRCFDAYGRAGEMTVSEFAAETGKKIGAIRAALRYAVQLGLATFEQAHQRSPKVYTFAPDFWLRVDEFRPNLRTYSLPEQRENARLKQQQQNVQRWSEGQPPDSSAALWAQNKVTEIAKERFSLLWFLLTATSSERQIPQEIIKRMAFEFEPATGFSFNRQQYTARTDAQHALRSTVSELKEQGIKGKDARRMLAMAGYTQADLRPSIVGAL